MDPAVDHKIKHIKWPPGALDPRRVPILLQDLNGPCPLIAIANVLLLRGTLSLPAGVGEISQARLVELVAGHLLDANIARLEGQEGSVEYRANLQHNLSDAISLLPKLTTGVDVNVKFDHIRSVEFTDETAVFDLLGIDLVHGWLVDPQDVATAAAVKSRSYNELVIELVTALGGAASPVNLTPAASRRMSQHAPAEPAASAFATLASQQPQDEQQPRPAAKPIDASTLAAALQSTLRITIPDAAAPSGARSLSSAGSSHLSRDSVKSELNRMLGDTVTNAFKTPGSTPGSMVAVPPLPALEQERQEVPSMSSSRLVRSGHGGEQTTSPFHATEGQPQAAVEQDPPVPPLLVASVASLQPPPHPVVAASHSPGSAPQASAPPPATASTAAAVPGEPAAVERKASSPGERAVRDALIIREFLDGSPSQLTVHGLASLVEGLAGGQLAVFFRNNHFNVMYKQGACAGALCLYLLVTDQGYLYEPEVVWERLDNVGGDTQLLGWDLKPFAPHAPAQQPVDDEAVAALAAAGEWEAGSDGGNGTTDADYALAMAMQQEEEERVRREEQRRRESRERQQQAQRAQQEAQRAQQQGAASRPPRPGAAPGGGVSRPEKKWSEKTSDCCVM